MKDRFQNFTVLISQISRNIKRIKTEEMKEFNLKAPHVSCLYYIYKEGSLTAVQLTDICSEDKASISRSLDYLEENGFIICEDVKKKKYNSILKLTPKGIQAGEKLHKKVQAVLNEAGAGLTEENRKIFYESLQLISNNLNEIVNK